MPIPTSRFRPGRRVLAAAVAASAFLFFSGIPTIAGSIATIESAVYDPAGRPVAGYTVVMKDVASGPEFVSRPSTRSGEYTIDVPVGARYRVVSIVTPSGESLPVRQAVPVSVRGGGSHRMNVHLRVAPGSSSAQIAPGATGGGLSTSAKVVAVVIVAAAIGVFAFSDDSSERPASASVPF
jgi:hypothetical protein